MIKVAIVGGTGYTGAELLRILATHPQAEVAIITSRTEQGKPVAQLFPNLRGHCDLAFSAPSSRALAQADVVFFATPHGVAQSMMAEVIEAGAKVIDLSADFRIRDVSLWQHWYGQAHQCPELIDKAVYGLPETNRDKIKAAQLVACPGCYPTSVQLGFLPLLEAGLVDSSHLIANCASGVSGAGRQANISNLFSETSDSFKAYAVDGHRHLPEIEQGLKDIQQQAGVEVNANVTFVPHLLPMVRGIHSTLYAKLKEPGVDLQTLY